MPPKKKTSEEPPVEITVKPEETKRVSNNQCRSKNERLKKKRIMRVEMTIGLLNKTKKPCRQERKSPEMLKRMSAWTIKSKKLNKFRRNPISTVFTMH
jgi:hypothetical protein